MLVISRLADSYRCDILLLNDMVRLRRITLVLCVVLIDLRLSILGYTWLVCRGVRVVVLIRRGVL